MSVEILKLKSDYLEEIAILHHQYLEVGLLSQLGLPFLREFYKIIIKQKNILTFVALNNFEIIGFVTIGIDFKNLPRLLIVNLWKETVAALLKKPMLIPKVLELPFYPDFKDDSRAEIFSLVVKTKFRRLGVARQLIKTSKNEFKKRGVKNFKVSVRKRLKKANLFYQKIGLKKQGEITFFGEKMLFWVGDV